MLRVEQVDKTYRPPRGLLRMVMRSATSTSVVALRRADFEVRAGQIVGLVGPNGAGKTTLLKIVSTLISPTSGRVVVDGFDASHQAQEARERMGLLLTDERDLYWRLTGRQNLEFFGVMAGLGWEEARRRAADLLEDFELHERDRRVFGYSSGMRLRLGLARSLLHRPRLLVLDEPSRSLDPLAAADLGRRLRSFVDQGGAVLLSSHRLDEVEQWCDRVVVLLDGRQRFDGPTTQLAAGGTTAGAALRSMLDASEREEVV